MVGSENRQIARDSLFVMVELRLDGQHEDHRVKMRNLSAGGMMAEGLVRVTRGTRLWINLRNIGWTEGTVAWVQDNRFGIAFAQGIDPSLARTPTTKHAAPETFVIRRPTTNRKALGDGPMRKV